MPTDSTGQPIKVGDRVRWRGEDYTIRSFLSGQGIHGVAGILFEEPQHLEGLADEVSVDLVVQPEQARK